HLQAAPASEWSWTGSLTRQASQHPSLEYILSGDSASSNSPGSQPLIRRRRDLSQRLPDHPLDLAWLLGNRDVVHIDGEGQAAASGSGQISRQAFARHQDSPVERIVDAVG